MQRNDLLTNIYTSIGFFNNNKIDDSYKLQKIVAALLDGLKAKDYLTQAEIDTILAQGKAAWLNLNHFFSHVCCLKQFIFRNFCMKPKDVHNSVSVA